MIRMSLLTVVLAASWAFAPIEPRPTSTPTSITPAAHPLTNAVLVPTGVHIDGSASTDQKALVAEAITSFEQFGLDVPSALVRFGDSGSDCSDHMGLFSPGQEQPIITVCSELPFVVTHELAHVWIHENLNDDAKQAYVEERDLPTWRSRDHDWNERGVEDAAFVMQQVLMFGEDRSTSGSWQERVEAFHLLIDLSDVASSSAA